MRIKIAVIMLTPPHQEEIWYGRCDQAIEVAKRTGGILILAGDSNNGSDLDKFEARALKAGLPKSRIKRAFNGHDQLWKNTRGDARASAKVIAELEDVDQVIVVTCWYHLPRAMIAMRQTLAARLPERYIRLRTSAVWQNIWFGLTMLVFRDRKTGRWIGELRGAFDYLTGNPQQAPSEPVGKPGMIGS